MTRPRFILPEAQVLKIYGHSDDSFCVEYSDGKGVSHDDAGQGLLRTWRVKAPDGTGLHISGRYPVSGAVWMIGISQLDEEKPLPPWPMRWDAEDYTVVLWLHVPAGTVVELVEIDGKEYRDE